MRGRLQAGLPALALVLALHAQARADSRTLTSAPELASEPTVRSDMGRVVIVPNGRREPSLRQPGTSQAIVSTPPAPLAPIQPPPTDYGLGKSFNEQLDAIVSGWHRSALRLLVMLFTALACRPALITLFTMGLRSHSRRN